MTYKGYAFRGSFAGGSGFPGDGPNDTWANSAVNYAYPENGGLGYGWAFSPGGNVGNRNSPVNARYGGQFSNNSSAEWFRIDCPNGEVDVRLLLGSGNNAVRLRHGSGSVANTDYHDVTGSSSTSYPQATDAQGAIFSDANAWDAGNTPLRVTVTAGYLQIEKQPSVSFNTTAFISFQPVTSNFVDCTFTDEAGTPGVPTLYESQPAQKLVGQIIQSVGGKPYSSLGVFENDGVTPSLYLEIVYINGVPWLRHKAVRMPNLSGTYNFKIIQTDISGQGYYPNSPYAQSCAWTVVAAPTKPYNDGTILSKISTPCFLQRKKVVDIFQQSWNPATKVGEWPGYAGGNFDFTATVYNYTQLKAQLKAYQSAAKTATNTKYRILIDQDGTSDWTTHSMEIAQNQWPSGDNGLDMYPQNGNLLYITYAAGPKAGPVLYGGWNFYLCYIRGVHVDGLVWGFDASATTEVDGGSQWPYGAITWGHKSTSSTTMGILKVTNCDIGLMFNPAYIAGGGGVTPKTIDTSRFGSGFATGSNGDDMEQFICSDCRFWGVNISFTLTGTRMVHIKNVDIALCNNDSLAMQCLRTEASANFPDMLQYEWHDNVNLRYVYNYDSGIHADFLQQRALGNGNHDAANMTYRLFENGTCYLNYDDPAMQRNCQIVSDAAAISSCYINNIFSHNATRGIDTGGGAGISYCEYNSLPPNNLSGVGATVQPQSIYSSWGAKVFKRNNINSANDGGEGNVHFSSVNTSGVDPNTIMVGPFGTDVNNSARWAAPALPEAVPTYDLSAYKSAMQAAFVSKTGADAGFQSGIAAPNGNNQAALNLTELF